MSATALEQTQDLDAENAPQSDDGAQGAKAKTPPKKNGGGAMFAQKTMNVLSVIGLGFLNPFIRLAMGENPKGALADLWKMIGVPVLAVLIFLAAWSAGAAQVKTSLGQIPGPAAVWEQFGALMDDHKAAREREAEFYERQDGRNAEFIANGEPERVREGAYTGPPTYIDQIFTSLRTVFFGFLIATLFAVPIGIFCGLSPTVNAAFNPLIQVFKPVSPLAWLPIVTLIVSAVYVSDDPMFPRAFVTSAITVTLCCIWPTIINTTVGVAGIDKDLLNVSRVLRLGWFTKVRRIVIPSAIPMMFAGLRLSLGIGWMVLIAAEMLAQNPGLGKFVWDEFQNGSSNSLGRIMVAVFAIGLIGFLLDRLMLGLQRWLSWDRNAVLR
jgi:nitrate/nitrite transport system permease protein